MKAKEARKKSGKKRGIKKKGSKLPSYRHLDPSAYPDVKLDVDSAGLESFQLNRLENMRASLDPLLNNIRCQVRLHYSKDATDDNMLTMWFSGECMQHMFKLLLDVQAVSHVGKNPSFILLCNRGNSKD